MIDIRLILFLCMIWPFFSGICIYFILKMAYFDNKITSNLVLSREGDMYLQISEEDYEKVKKDPTITLKIQRV